MTFISATSAAQTDYAHRKINSPALKEKIDTYQNYKHSLETKFESRLGTEDFDKIYSELAVYFITKDDFYRADTFIKKIRSKFILKETYVRLVGVLAKNDSNLPLACSFAEQTIKLASFEKQMLNEHIFDKKDWEEKLKKNKGSLTDVYAELLHREGKIEQAIRQSEIALELNDFDPIIKTHMLKFLVENMQYQRALDLGAGYVKSDQTSEQIKTFMLESFEAINNTSNGFQKYYSELLGIANQQYALPINRIINFKSINFSLPDIYGKNVTLSSLKGKTVMLYFFNTNKDNPELVDSLNSYFDRLAFEYKDTKDIVCLGIDVTASIYNEEKSSQEARVSFVKKWLKSRSYSYPVLFDKYHYDRYFSRNCYFQVADNYSSNDVGQFFILDKTGVVRYKSYPPSINPNFERFKREVVLALSLSK
ncbi:peroxiredoxin family protein [Pedobacter sp. UYP24]